MPSSLVPLTASPFSAAMASRYCAISRPAISLLKHATKTHAIPPIASNPSSLLCSPSRSVARKLGALQTILPLHSAVSSARLISRLGIDACGSASSRSMSQELGLSVPR